MWIMITRASFFKLLVGLLCFCLQVSCSDENDPLPNSSDITSTTTEDGIWAAVDVNITGVAADKIEECGIEWTIIPETDGQVRIGEKDHIIKQEGGSLSYSFRIFPWSHFLAKVYNNKCCISVTPYVRVNGQIIKGHGGRPKEINTNTKVYLWSYNSEIVNTYDIRFPGKFIYTGRLTIEECGIYWSEDESDDLKDYTKCVSPETTPDFSVTIPGIAHLDKIYLICYVKTSYGTFYSNISGTYLPGDKVTITIASEVKDPTFERVTVTGNCTVENPAIYPITERGFCYRLSSDDYLPTINNDKITVDAGEGIFSGTISGLEPFTRYIIRAYAISNGRVTYSKSINTYTLYSLTFRPSSLLLSAKVNPDQPGRVVLEGKVFDDCGYMVTERGFCYSTSGQSPTIDDHKVVADGTGLGTFKTELNLSPGKYFFKTYAINQAGLRYSSEVREVVVR